MIDATLDFKPEHLAPEHLAAYFRQVPWRIPNSPCSPPRTSIRPNSPSHKALLDQRDRLAKPTEGQNR